MQRKVSQQARSSTLASRTELQNRALRVQAEQISARLQLCFFASAAKRPKIEAFHTNAIVGGD